MTCWRWLVRLQRRFYKRLRLCIWRRGSGEDTHGGRTRSLPLCADGGTPRLQWYHCHWAHGMVVVGRCDCEDEGWSGALAMNGKWIVHRNSTVVVTGMKNPWLGNNAPDQSVRRKFWRTVSSIPDLALILLETVAEVWPWSGWDLGKSAPNWRTRHRKCGIRAHNSSRLYCTGK